MLDRDRLKDLHNQVTDLHKMTSAAAGGVGAIDWTGALEMVINVLNLFKDHLNVVENETRQAAMNISKEPNQTTIQQGDHQELPRDKDNLTKHIEPVDTKDQ